MILHDLPKPLLKSRSGDASVPAESPMSRRKMARRRLLSLLAGAGGLSLVGVGVRAGLEPQDVGVTELRIIQLTLYILDCFLLLAMPLVIMLETS